MDDRDFRRLRAVVRDAGAEANGRIAVGEAGRIEVDARRGVIEQIDVQRVGGDQPDIAVDPSVKREVGIQGRDVVVVPVLDADSERVRRVEGDGVGHVESEGRVATDVRAHALPVHEDLGDLIRAFEIEEELLPAQRRVEPKRLPIPAGAAPVSLRFVEGVLRVPRVREGYPLPAGIVEAGRGGLTVRLVGEAPAVVERHAQACALVGPREAREAHSYEESDTERGGEVHPASSTSFAHRKPTWNRLVSGVEWLRAETR